MFNINKFISLIAHKKNIQKMKDYEIRFDRLVDKILKGKSLCDIIIDTTLQKQVISEFESLLKTKTEKLQQSASPYLINISGIPGSGKTTLAKQILSRNSELLYVSFDEIMENISFYKSDCQKLGAECAFTKWELPARYLGYKLLRDGLINRYPILFDHSNAFLEHIELYKIIKGMGYKTEIQFIDIDLKTAIERSKKRLRFVPEKMIRDRHKLLKNLNLQYNEIVDKFIVLNKEN
jgi:Predicted kinase